MLTHSKTFFEVAFKEWHFSNDELTHAYPRIYCSNGELPDVELNDTHLCCGARCASMAVWR